LRRFGQYADGRARRAANRGTILAMSSVLARWFASSPLRRRQFRYFYVGSVGSALAYTMQATVASWMMATLTPSALLVALVQTASTAPSLLLALLAGSLADIVNRRRIILGAQVVLVAATIVLGAAALAGVMNPAMLLALTFLVGAAFTFYLPAQQASVNELVRREDLPKAVALGAVAFNVARAIGPALAGAIVAWAGTGSALLASAAGFGVTIAALRGWRVRPPALPGVPETLISGVLAGLRFARHSEAMRALIVRNVIFCLCGSSLWALMPLVARDQLGLDAGGFGLLLSTFGAGAVVCALSIPRQLQRRPLNTVVTSSVVLSAAATLLIAATNITAVALVGAFAAGAAWVGVLASLSAGTQSAAPAWVRARSMALILLAVQASLAVGSAIWGALASVAGTAATLAAAAGAMLLLHALNRRVRVDFSAEADVTPYAALPDLALKVEPMPDDGPVLVQVDYRIDFEHRAAFMHAIRAVEPTRRRNGASSWRVFHDVGEDGRFVERFIIESWAEYIRSRSRMTVADRQLQDVVAALQRADVPIRISRLIGVDLDEELPSAGDDPGHDA
jgi:MFS family permease